MWFSTGYERTGSVVPNVMELYREGLSHMIWSRALMLFNLDRKFRETA